MIPLLLSHSSSIVLLLPIGKTMESERRRWPWALVPRISETPCEFGLLSILLVSGFLKLIDVLPNLCPSPLEPCGTRSESLEFSHQFEFPAYSELGRNWRRGRARPPHSPLLVALPLVGLEPSASPPAS